MGRRLHCICGKVICELFCALSGASGTVPSKRGSRGLGRTQPFNLNEGQPVRHKPRDLDIRRVGLVNDLFGPDFDVASKTVLQELGERVTHYRLWSLLKENSPGILPRSCQDLARTLSCLL